MAELTEQEIATDLARELVATLSPQELALFRVQSEAYFQNPQKALERGAGRDEMLGFGLGETATFLTPVALAVAQIVVPFVAEVLRDSAKEQTGSLINKGVKRFFKRSRKKSHAEAERTLPPPLTSEQVTRIRQVAFEKARQLLPEAQAGLLADSVVGNLTIGSS